MELKETESGKTYSTEANCITWRLFQVLLRPLSKTKQQNFLLKQSQNK